MIGVLDPVTCGKITAASLKIAKQRNVMTAKGTDDIMKQ